MRHIHEDQGGRLWRWSKGIRVGYQASCVVLKKKKKKRERKSTKKKKIYCSFVMSSLIPQVNCRWKEWGEGPTRWNSATMVIYLEEFNGEDASMVVKFEKASSLMLY